MDMLGVPFKYVTGYRSSPAARLAFQRGEINFFSESPPSYRGVVDPTLVKTGQAIPVFYDAGFDGKEFFVPDAVKGLPILTFHELYQKIKGTMPSGQLWDIYKAIIAADGIIQRLIVMPPGAPQAGGRRGARGDRARQRRSGLCRGGGEGVRLRAAMGRRLRHAQGGGDRAHGAPGGADVSGGLHEEFAEVTPCRPPHPGERA